MGTDESDKIWEEINTLRDKTHNAQLEAKESTVRLEYVKASLQKLNETNADILKELVMLREDRAARHGGLKVAVASVPIIAAVVSYLTTKLPHS